MIKIITYKKQGNGNDSWHVDIHDCATQAEATRENRVSRDIVFEDPTVEKLIDISKVDLSTLTNDQWEYLKAMISSEPQMRSSIKPPHTDQETTINKNKTIILNPKKKKWYIRLWEWFKNL